jgi:hypothetical protein
MAIWEDNNRKEIKMNTEMGDRGAKDSAVGGDGVLHLYAPFEGLKGVEPVPLVAAIPFYSDPEMTDAIGTLTIVGVTIPSEELPSYFYCDIAFGWHGKDENLAAADTILTMTGMMIQGDPRAGAERDASPAFLQLFAITGGTGKYVGAKGQATIDGSLGLQDYRIVLA